MELRDSSLGWAKRVEVSRRMRKRSGRIKRGVKALNYRLELIENHLSEISKGARGGPRPGRARYGAGGWFFTHAKVAKVGKPRRGSGRRRGTRGGILNG